MSDILAIEHALIAVLSVIPVLIAWHNHRSWRLIDDSLAQTEWKFDGKLSVLIPARNEEERIAQCINGLINQSYPNLEIIVLNDESTDETAAIVEEISKKDQRVRLVNGKPLPSDGWIGKHWACCQLVEEAKGELILFVDADTSLKSGVLNITTSELIDKSVDLLTLNPRRISKCWTEKMLNPFIDWATFCFLPMGLAHSIAKPYLSATFGQFMLFKKVAYESIGGHEAVRNNILDDMELGRMILRNGFRWRLLDGRKYVETQAYNSNLATISGISRNILPTFDYHIGAIAIAVVVFFALGIGPFISIAYWGFGRNPDGLLGMLSLLTVLMISTSWLMSCIRAERSPLNVLLFPAAIFLMLLVAGYSCLAAIVGVANWKGRRLVKHDIHI